MIIAVANQKGGCTKSTTTIQLARWLGLKKRSVLLVDADGQRSSSIWANALSDDSQPTGIEILSDANDILEQVPVMATGHDYALIDCPGAIAEVSRAALFVADGVIIPIMPSGLDLRSSSDAVRLLKQAQQIRKGLPLAVLFLARAQKGTNSKETALALIQRLGYPVMGSVIHQRDVVSGLFMAKSTIFDATGRAAKDVAREFDHLFNEVFETWQKQP